MHLPKKGGAHQTRDGSELEYRVLVEMCEHTQVDKPVVTIGSPRLALLCGSRPESVRNCWRRLKEKGFIYPVGRHGGGNKVDRWRLIDNGMRTNPDGQPLWDPKGWDAGVYCESAQRCEACGQPSSTDAQPSSTTLSTVIPDALNRNPGITRSSYEVERSNYEVDAPYGRGPTPPDGAPARTSVAPAGEIEEPNPIPVNDDNPALTIYDWERWWMERVDDECIPWIPLDRPPNNCGRDTHKHQPAPGCSPCAKAAKTAALWKAAYDGWSADCCDKRQAIRGCGDCDSEGYQFNEDGTMRWCDHAAAKAAAIEAAKAAAIAQREREQQWNAVRDYHFDRFADQVEAAQVADIAVEHLADHPDSIDEVFSEIDNLLTKKQAEAAEAAAAAAEEAELDAAELQEEIDCAECGPPGPKHLGDGYIKAGGTPLVAVFPPGRVPHWEDYREDEAVRDEPPNRRGGAIELFKMPLPDGGGAVEYAQLFCDHHPELNQHTIDDLVKNYGALVMPLTQLGGAGNGFGFRALASTDDTAAITEFVTPALPAADTVDAEVIDDELVGGAAAHEPAAAQPDGAWGVAALDGLGVVDRGDSSDERRVDGVSLGLGQEVTGSTPGLAELE